MSDVLDPVPWLIGRIVLAALFFTAAVHKLRDRGGFAQAISGYALLPAGLVSVAAVSMPAAELVVAIGLLMPQPIGSAAACGATLLLFGYAAAVGVNLLRGRREIDCGCGGPAGRQTIHAGLVARNLLAALVAVAVAGSPLDRERTWFDGFTVVVASLCVVLLWISVDYLFANRHRLVGAHLRSRSEPTEFSPRRREGHEVGLLRS